MILLEQQVCSLKLATKLKQLGIEQKSLFYWAKFFYREGKSHQWGVEPREQNELEAYEYGHTKIEDVENYSAFTVAEIGELLPRYCEITYRNRSGDRKQIRWNCNNHFSETEASTMVDAFAEMLIYLIEHNLYDPKTKKKQTTV